MRTAVRAASARRASRQKTLEKFDFTFQRSVQADDRAPRPAPLPAARENVILFGPPSAGKWWTTSCLTPQAANLIFMLVFRRYERAGLIVTSRLRLGLSSRPVSHGGRFSPALQVNSRPALTTGAGARCERASDSRSHVGQYRYADQSPRCAKQTSNCRRHARGLTRPSR